MLKFIQSTFLLLASLITNAQNITLIQDANPGSSGSVRGMSAELNGDIYYIGFKAGQFGNQLFKYDSSSGSVQSVSTVFNTSKNLLVASSGNIYVADGNRLSKFNTDNNNLISIFENSSPSEDFESIVVKDEIIVALSESFDGNWNVFLINESTGVSTKVNAVSIDEELAATIGNDYVAIRAFGTFADEEKGNMLIEKTSGNEVVPSDVIEDSPCTDIINMLAIGDYILYDCNDGNRYIYSVSQKTSYDVSGFAKDVRENDSYVFIHAGQSLYSFNKSTNELENLEFGIQHIGMVNDFDGTLYFLKSFQDKLFSTDGAPNNVIVYNIEGEVGSGSKIIGVLDFNDTPVVAYNEGVRDFWILKVKDQGIESLTGLIELNSDFLPFFKLGNNLIFSYDHPEFGEELFETDFAPTPTKDEITKLDVIELFPNPAIEMLTIKSNYKITASRAMDVYGKSFKLRLTDGNTIDLYSLHPGIYTLLCTTNDPKIELIQKFVKL